MYTDEMERAAALVAIEQRAAGKRVEELQPALIKKYGYKRGKLAYQEAVTRENMQKATQAAEAQTETEKRWEGFWKTGEIPSGIGYKEKTAMLRAQNLRATGQATATGVDVWQAAEDLMARYSPATMQQMKRDGKWGEIYALLNPGGRESEAYKELARYSNGENIKGTMVPEKYARNQWMQATGKNPTGKNKIDSENFLTNFNLMAEQRAEELKLKSVNFLPRDEQDKIITHLMEPGDWTSWNYGMLAGWDWFNADYPRYQAMGFEGYEKYWIPKNAPEAPAPAAAPAITGGIRDTAEARAGGTEITTPNGTIQQVSEDGKAILSHLPKPTPKPELGDEFFDENHGEEEHPAILAEMLEEPNSYRRWRGTHWEVYVPSRGVFHVRPDGAHWGI
ncbi:MAG: hypothetical protein LIP77_02240 [Planctomycetes bacterium]|nr:hypothetical protein [Planctomycetota bacterium]